MTIESGSSTLPRRTDHRLFLWAAIAAFAIVVAGFARSYFLKGLFGSPPLTGLLHLHGLVMTLWFMLLIVQVRLVGSGRIDLHRRLGMFGGLVAVLVIVIGTMTAITGARLGHSPGPPPLVFLAIPLGEMVAFAALVGLGLGYRQRGAIHKRLIVLASLSMLTPAIARIPLDVIHNGGLPVFFALTDVVLLACIGLDTVRNRRLHPAFGWGFLFIIAGQGLRFWLAGTPLWQSFAGWLVGQPA